MTNPLTLPFRMIRSLPLLLGFLLLGWLYLREQRGKKGQRNGTE